MSEFHVVVLEIGKVGKHPNADTLSITTVLGGYPVIFRTGQFQPGDKAVYCPVDSVCPVTDPRFSFLGSNNRLKAKRLRGIFSMGILVEADPSWEVGQNVQNELGITKWDPQAKLEMGGENEYCPFHLPHYTDLESLRKHPHALTEDLPVVITEKVHGANARYCYSQDRLWVGSHHCIKKESDGNMWWQVARKDNLLEKLKTKPDLVFFGEVYGQVQDLRYGHAQGASFAAFDVLNLKTMRYMDYEDFVEVTEELGIPRVPVLYIGPWNDSLRSLSEGDSTVPGASNIREGIVIRPQKEMFSGDVGGRLVVKLVGEQYLTRKEKD
jgi:RNA ligase (TIGR02306 family)